MAIYLEIGSHLIWAEPSLYLSSPGSLSGAPPIPLKWTVPLQKIQFYCSCVQFHPHYLYCTVIGPRSCLIVSDRVDESAIKFRYQEKEHIPSFDARQLRIVIKSSGKFSILLFRGECGESFGHQVPPSPWSDFLNPYKFPTRSFKNLNQIRNIL